MNGADELRALRMACSAHALASSRGRRRSGGAIPASASIATTSLYLHGEDAETVKQFAGNFRGALNQRAFVMQTLRSRMGDVHGTKPVLKQRVFGALKWAELFVHTLTVR